MKIAMIIDKFKITIPINGGDSDAELGTARKLNLRGGVSVNRFKTFMLFAVYPLAFFFLYAILFRKIEDYAEATFSVVPLRFFEILVPIVYGFTIGIIRNQKCTCGKLLWQSIYLLAAIGIILFGEIHVTLHRYMDVFSGFPILAITIGIYLHDLVYAQVKKRKDRQ